MAIDWKSLHQRALTIVFSLGGDFVKDATFFRPASFNPNSGQTVSAESSAACKTLVLSYRRMELGLVSIQPGDEKVLVRASELVSISAPGAGDYLVETVTGLRRDILSGRLDSTGELWVFQTTRSLNEDWGELTAATVFEDRGDLTAATDFDDWGALV